MFSHRSKIFWWWVAAALVITGTVASTGRLMAQDDRGDGSAAETQDDDPAIREELAKIDQIWNDGKKKKATDMVRELYERTGSLRAGYALWQVLQKQGEEQLKRTPKKANPFVTEAAELSRRLLTHPRFPAALRAEVRGALLNEAQAFSSRGDQEQALQSLRDLAGFGFADLDSLEADRLLKNLTKTEAFQDWIAEVRRERLERNLRWARSELKNFQSFSFDFNQSDVREQPISLNMLQGKIVIVDFWGTWCPPCRKEVPSYVALKQKFANDLEIVGLAYEKQVSDEEKIKSVLDFAKQNKINYICALGQEHTREMVPNFRGYPTTLFIDRRGKVRMMKVGAYSLEQLEAIILAILEEQPPIG